MHSGGKDKRRKKKQKKSTNRKGKRTQQQQRAAAIEAVVSGFAEGEGVTAEARGSLGRKQRREAREARPPKQKRKTDKAEATATATTAEAGDDDDEVDSAEVVLPTFGELGVCEPLCEAVAAMKWSSPTPIQAQSIPVALQGRDIIGLAQTGSGKTGAFALPMLQALLDAPQAFFGCVMAPTRELAFQIAEDVEAMGAVIGVKTTVVVGGMDAMQQAIALAKKPHIVVATPGRLLHHLENTKGFSLVNLKYLVFDEADRMFSQDFEEDIDKILECMPKKRVTFLYSATMTAKVAKLQRVSLTNPVKVEVDDKYSTVDNLVQNYVFIPIKYKECYLTYLLNEFAGNSAIVFCSTCNGALKMAVMLRTLGFQAVPLHGQLTQAKRLGALGRFKSGQRNVLVATDVASRGLDIPDVDLVINYDIPSNSKDYVHRVGRTARAGKGGRSITVVTQYDVELLQRIEKLIGRQMEEYVTEEEAVLVLQERVSAALRIAQEEIREMEDKRGGRKKGMDGVQGIKRMIRKKKQNHGDGKQYYGGNSWGKRSKKKSRRA